MPSQLSTSIQNTFIKAGANLTAQVVARWQSNDPKPLDLQRILEFAIFGFVGAQLGYMWQCFLEDTFPTRTTATISLTSLSASASSSSAVPSVQVVAPGDKDDAGKIELVPTSPHPHSHPHRGGPATTTTGPGEGPMLDPRNAPGIRWRNVWAKLIADQTVGISLMITIFLIITNIARQPTFGDVLVIIRQKLFGLVRAGWHIWPAVAIINFIWVPVRWRVLISSFVGFGWNIFLSVFSMSMPAPGPLVIPDMKHS